jgi:tRNA(fMet)-specific endonuclease VapC
LPAGHEHAFRRDRPAEQAVGSSRQAVEIVPAYGHFVFSDVSCYEILRGLRKKQAHIQEQRFQVFCGHCERLPVTAEVFDRAATLWAQGQRQGINVDDADLIIAATALIQRLAVATANPRHFEWIDGLSLSNWRDP